MEASTLGLCSGELEALPIVEKGASPWFPRPPTFQPLISASLGWTQQGDREQGILGAAACRQPC
jgi:hypothetical protein